MRHARCVDPSWAVTTVGCMSDAILVRNAELVTIREAMRELNRIVDALEDGTLDKLVLTQRNRMRAVLVSLDRFVALELAAEAARREAGRRAA